MFKKKKIGLYLIFIAVFILLIFFLLKFFLFNSQSQKDAFQAVESSQRLDDIYRQATNSGADFSTNPWLMIVLAPLILPASLLTFLFSRPVYYEPQPLLFNQSLDRRAETFTHTIGAGAISSSPLSAPQSSAVDMSVERTDFSTTNIQVENVDEADILKTDGRHIYSLSTDQVIISAVDQPQAPRVLAKIKLTGSAIPEDLLLYKNNLIIIGSNLRGQQTVVNIFSLENYSQPLLVKEFSLKQKYFTSRLVNDKLYLLADGYLEKDIEEKYDLSYSEDKQEKAVSLDKLYFLPQKPSDDLTAIATLDLSQKDYPLLVQMYLTSLEQAYVSQENLYLISEAYQEDFGPDSYERELFWQRLKSLFSWRGIFGLWLEEDDGWAGDYNLWTQIYKFKLTDEKLQFVAKLSTQGQSLNQFSFDEDQAGNLRLALQVRQNGNDWRLTEETKSTKVEIYDRKLQLIGSLENLAPGEDMRAARFVGKRVYLVTFETIDPLFVIDLQDPHQPKVLGELKIPGYSTYLHPYDDNHLIGIGLDTQENIIRDDQGRVISAGSTREGMKMALFDVSQVKNPRELAKITIGNRQTTSAVLSNHKALLFSKEKNLLAIPIKNHPGLEENPLENESALTRMPNFNYLENEGYLVYKITLTDGFEEKGQIIHPQSQEDDSLYRNQLLRGLYIGDNLFTVSQNQLQVHQLTDLKLLAILRLNESEVPEELKADGLEEGVFTFEKSLIPEENDRL